MSPTPIDALCRDLDALFRRDPRGARAAELLGRYAAEQGDWREWTFFEDGAYTRNLVHRTGCFELLLLCWEVGQASPVHDHAGQQCWMAVLDGPVEEIHFRERAAGQPLLEGSARRFEAGQVAYIADEIALHLVRATPGRRGVSLHLYSDPIDACRTYDPRTGEARRMEVGYHSVRGELCGAKSPQTVRAEWA